MVDKNQVKIEDKWQQLWSQKKVFEPKIDKSKSKYFGTVAYPYANSVAHIGHGRAYTIADVYLRYQRLLGKIVLQPLGFHISGTPVLAVADGVKNNNPKTLKQVRDAVSDYVYDKKRQDELIKTFCDPKNIADFFSHTWEGSLNSIGISIDWSRQFSTGEAIYNKFIEWQYSKLKEKGLLKQGKYPILYSAFYENAVGEDDIDDGDIDKVSISYMVGIKFKIVGTDEYILCATLRPDALFGATNLWVKPDMNLVKLKVNNEIWIVSKKAQVKVEHQFENVEWIADLKGEELLDKKVIAPLIDKEIPIYKSEFSKEDHGTGIVYSSPADSPHDYIDLFETLYPNKSLSEFIDKEPLRLNPITETFDKKGKKINYKFDIPAYDVLIKNKIYNSKNNEDKLEEIKQSLYKEAHFGAKMINAGEFDNLPLKNNIGADRVKEKLFEKQLGVNFYETSRRAKTRGGDDVIVANIQGQWFLDYSNRDVKNKALDLLNSADFYPINLKETQRGYIEWANLRPCARKRGLGTQIPYDRDWIIEPLSDSTIYQVLYMISHLIRKYDINPEELTFEFFDYIYLNKGTFNDVIKNNCINTDFVKLAKEEVDYWNNVDLRYVGMPHMSNHLNFLIYHYSLIFPRVKWPKMIVTGSLMMRDGKKISKSKGNGTPLFRIKNIYGADLYRLYIITNSNYDVEMDFKEEEILQLEKKFEKFKLLIKDSVSSLDKSYDDFSTTNKWLISKFYSRVKEYFSFFNDFRIREAFIVILYEFLNDISYHERRTSLDETLEVIKFISQDYVQLMTPVVPHICEELNEKIGKNNEFVSLQSFNTNPDKYINIEAEKKEGVVEEIVTNILRMKNSKNISKISNIKIVIADDLRYELFDLINNELEKTRDFKTIFNAILKTNKFEKEMKFIQKFLPKTLKTGLTTYIGKEEELKLIDEVKVYLENKFNAKVEIVNAKDFENNINAIPSKPSIFIEG